MVSFDAKLSNERSFFVSPSGDGDNGWEKYVVYEASVGPEVANYNFVFEMTSTTDPTARLEFNLGNNIGTLWIGNVSVTELKAEDGIDHDMKKSPLADAKMYQNGIQVNGGADYMISMDISGEKAAEGIMDSEAVFTLSIPEGTSVEVDNIRMCMVKE